MPACIVNIARKPIEGQSFNVLNAVIGTMESHGLPGNVTMTLTTNLGSGISIIATIR